MNLSVISIIIPAYNAEKTIKSCVNALLHQEDCCAAIEVIVIDDGSSDATAEIVKSFDRVKYFWQKNAGPASARNAGVRQAAGELICFIDSDCQPRGDWAKRLFHYFETQDVDVLAGSYGLANQESMLARCIHQEIMFRHQQLMGDWVEVFGSYNVAFRREVFERLNGFDESYRAASGEDNDLSYRLRKAGVQIRFAKDVVVDHHHPVCLKRYIVEQFRHGFWRAKLYRDHPDMMTGDGYTFLKDAFEVPLVAALLMLFVLSFFTISWVVFWVVLLAALGFECFFAAKFKLVNYFESLFFAWVMLLRAGARAFGLTVGFLTVKPS